MSPHASAIGATLVCAGCDTRAPAPEMDPYPFRCAHTGDDVDHIMIRTLDDASIAFPQRGDANPFVRYRQLFYSYHLARSRGMSDDDYVGLVRDLDEAVARVDGRGFRATPFFRSAALSERLGFAREGGVWVKDETGNVSGSHKARHLMGIMIYLVVLERIGLVGPPLPSLAIASCGNAALAAAVVARAADRVLRVFVPPDAASAVADRLAQLGAEIRICRREPGQRGDPCYQRFRAEVANGALPFCCQGPDNGLTIEGGETLGFEIVGAPGVPPLDDMVIQVGGGALASAVIQSFTDAVAHGAVTRLPRFWTVQTRGAFPLERAYDRVTRRLLESLARHGLRSDEPVVDLVARHLPSAPLQQEMHYAATHRSEFMWPWEEEPRSIAHGILDDETYDWLAVVRGMIASRGEPAVVDEPLLVEAFDLAREATGIDVDHTGTAGLAGLLQKRRDGSIGPRENVVVIFSGVRRDSHRGRSGTSGG